jgi:D-aspartate ligase
MDLIRPLALAGAPCVAAAPPGDAVRYSRLVSGAVEWADHWEEPETLVERLVAFGRAQATHPVLFYEADPHLLLVSRHRDRLAEAYDFVIADEALVDSLVDKHAFQALAERLGLPIPPSIRLRPGADPLPSSGLAFPLVVKPLTRRVEEWEEVASGKAVRVDTRDELAGLWPRFAAAGLDVLAQELVPGPESRIESYHVYIDEAGDVAGEFTGRKIRTYPIENGYSTAVMVTATPEVADLGREVIRALDLRGVAKVDFKRGPDGALRLLEVNPRFTLWNHVGALAGVNLPALVYADLAGLPRPRVSPVRAGATWCELRYDFRAARAEGVSLARWLAWMRRVDAKAAFSWDDPLPFVRGYAWPVVKRRLRRRLAGLAGRSR